MAVVFSPWYCIVNVAYIYTYLRRALLSWVDTKYVVRVTHLLLLYTCIHVQKVIATNRLLGDKCLLLTKTKRATQFDIFQFVMTHYDKHISNAYFIHQCYGKYELRVRIKWHCKNHKIMKEIFERKFLNVSLYLKYIRIFSNNRSTFKNKIGFSL